MNRRRIATALCWPCLAGLLSCAGAPPSPWGGGGKAAPDWPAHRARLQAMSEWRTAGKIVLRPFHAKVEAAAQRGRGSPPPHGGGTARLRWMQRGAAAQLELSGPMGAKPVIVESDGHGGGRVFRDGAWTSLPAGRQTLERVLGWPLPLEYLPWWLRGLPAPMNDTELRIRDAHLAQLRQGGWILDYGDFRRYGEVLLPGSIRFARADALPKTAASASAPANTITPDTAPPDTAPPNVAPAQRGGESATNAASGRILLRRWEITP